ncbi:hypothetical protein FRB90_008595 [Tulasnella sp. 427]|nr:hypothetical protein FRB90_008595 [Tulasnella sp. 427]
MRNTWGTSRSGPGIPSQVPQGLGARLFPASTSNRPMTSMSAVVQPYAGSREARATARQARKPNKGPNGTWHWYLVPTPNIFVLSTPVKIACTKASLGKYPIIMKDYTPDQVDYTIRVTFSSINFDTYSYRFMELNRATGTTIQPTGLDSPPSRDDLTAAYARKEIGIIQLVYPIPQEHDFWSHFNAEVDNNKQEVSDDEPPSPPPPTKCPVCEQQFAASVYANHEAFVSYSGASHLSLVPSTSATTKTRKVYLRVPTSPPADPDSGRSPEPASSGHAESVDNEAGGTTEQVESDAVGSPTALDGETEQSEQHDMAGKTEDSGHGGNPTMLCNFCDEAWPLCPLAQLIQLAQAAAGEAKPDPNPTNPNHLDLPLVKSIDICVHHCLEKDMEENGCNPLWPTSIDFVALPKRIVQLANAALNVARSPQGNRLFDALVTKIQNGLDLKSIHAAADPLIRTNCGYYGEKGFTAIADTLQYQVRHAIKLAQVTPMDPSDFYHYVIIPYVAFLLIKEDRPDLDEEAAWRELEQSNKFRLLRYPEDIEYE